MYYTTVPVQAELGHEHEAIDNDTIDKAIETALCILNEEASCPIVLESVTPIVIPIMPYPRVFLTIMAKPYEPPVRFAGVHAVQDILLQQAHKRGLER